MHLDLEIQPDPDAAAPAWIGLLRRPDQTLTTPLGRLDIGPEAKVPIGKGRKCRRQSGATPSGRKRSSMTHLSATSNNP